MTATVAFEAFPVQQKLMETLQDGRFRIIGFGGGIRGTKTWGTLAALVALCRIFPRSRWVVVRKDLERIRKNTLPSFNKLREQIGPFLGEVNQSTWTSTCANGSQIIFFGENYEEDKDLSRWKGLEANGFDLEEADELQEASYYKAIERAGAWIVPNGHQPPPLVLCTFNPCPNWPKRVFYEPWKNGTIAAPFAFIPATAADNPSIPESTREGWRSLPEQEYRRFVEGDWEVLSGRFYDNIDPRVHLIPRDALPQKLPDYWAFWGSFDWGYAHWAPFGSWTQDEDGNAYLLDTIWQRRDQDSGYAETIASTAHPACLRRVYAGHDCWQQVRARGASGITTADVFSQYGIYLTRADIDRVNGGRAVRRALDFERDQSGVLTRLPKIRFVDTPGNRKVLTQLQEIMPDENNVEKPAKVDADSEGRGGDDGADMVRYGVASRQAASSEQPEPVRKHEDRARPYDYEKRQYVKQPGWDDYSEEQPRRTPGFRRPLAKAGR